MTKRVLYLSIAITCFIACILIVKFFSNNLFIRTTAGDFIVVILIYFFAKGIIALKPLNIAVLTLLFSYTTEILQFFKIVNILGLEHNRIARIVIGTSFDPHDLIAYTSGVLFAYLIDLKIINRERISTLPE
jgi:hypothetical protein